MNQDVVTALPISPLISFQKHFREHVTIVNEQLDYIFKP